MRTTGRFCPERGHGWKTRWDLSRYGSHRRHATARTQLIQCMARALHTLEGTQLKANYTEFETKLGLQDCGSTFRQAVDKRPLKLKAIRFQYFTPTRDEDPFARLDGSVQPDFEVGTGYQMAELYGSVVMSCLSLEGGRTLVSLRSAGNMRGRMMTNTLVKHVLGKFQERDGSIAPEMSSGRL